jgi:hypothetical protein
VACAECHASCVARIIERVKEYKRERRAPVLAAAGSENFRVFVFLYSSPTYNRSPVLAHLSDIGSNRFPQYSLRHERCCSFPFLSF